MKNTYTMSALARLMAGENIAVIHSPLLDTAVFDLQKRYLMLPAWGDISPALYDLLLSHEISHALHTPLEGWHEALSVHGRSFKGYLNVLEDIRIERLIKNKYPGLVRTFSTAYRELLNRDFFGITERNINPNDMLFIDRINIYSKAGAFVPINFSEEEQGFLDEAFKTETFEDVKKLAERLYKTDQSITRNKKGIGKTKLDVLRKEYELLAEKLREKGSEGAGELAPEKRAPNKERKENVLDKLHEEMKKELDNETIDPGIDVKSETDEAFRNSEDSLIDDDVRKHMYGKDEKILVLEEVDLTKFIAPASKVHRYISEHAKNNSYTVYTNQESLSAFLRDENKVINQLVSEFEMRKNASQYARAGSAKTGSLNMKRLHAAKFSEDLFQRILKIPEGKSHGMMMYFDQSGSMHGIYKKTIEQIIVLVEFCRRMNIPFDVYGFCDDWHSKDAFFGQQRYSHPEKPTPGKVQLCNAYGHLKQYIHSGMSTIEYKEALLNMWRIRDRDLRPETEMLNGTPMNQAIALSGQMVKRFKQLTKVDVINVLFLTDGEASDQISVNSGSMVQSGTSRVLYNEHLSPRYKQDTYNRAACTAALVDLMSNATGANYIGIYIPGSMATARSAVRDYHNVTFFGTHKKNKFSFEKEGFFMTENYGFNSFFILKPLSSKTDVDLSEVNSKKSVSQVTRAFSKLAASRVQNRAFLAVFATQLSQVS